MTNMIDFRELENILDRSGWSVSKVSKIAKVSRNTVASIRDGSKVTPTSIAKILKAFSDFGVDVTSEFQVFKERKYATQTSFAADGTNGPRLVDDVTFPKQMFAGEAINNLDAADRNISALLREIRASGPPENQESLLDIYRLYNRIGEDIAAIRRAVKP